MNNYYVYLHIKATDGEPFYVGKGRRYRAYDSSKCTRSNHWINYVNKYGFDVIILENNLTEKEAFEKETYWIKRIGRKDLGNGPLINYSNGGEGGSGRVFTKEHKKKLGQRQLGSKNVSAKCVIDCVTGIYFDTVSEAAVAYNIPPTTLSSYLNGKRTNKTNLKFV
jgi:hypothetical protein